MKAVILAAGVGSRLGYPNPKSLLVLPTGESIIARQVRLLKSEGISDIIIVVGHKKELIMRELADITFIFNPDYQNTNTSKSLLCAVKNLDDDILWTNGDLIYDQEIIAAVKTQNFNTVIVNDSECGEEEVKYQLDGNGNITLISKEVDNARGEALGINLVKRESLTDFKKALEECQDNDYFEMAIQILINRDIIFKSYNVSGYRCIEVDFEEDWQRAIRMFGL